jgi:hypothetical protein
MGWTAGEPGFDSSRMIEVFLSSVVSTALVESLLLTA